MMRENGRKGRTNRPIHKKQRSGNPRMRLWIGSIVTALVAAVAVFAVMLQLEKNVLLQYEKGDIYLAAKDIPKGEVITQVNCGEYFTLQQLDKNCIPPGALTSVEQVQDLAAVYSIEKGVLLTAGMFEALDEVTDGMDEAVIAGFKAEDLYQVVGGVLRAGDRIHIYSVREEGGARLVWQSIYVQQVFDGTGKAIANSDATTSAQRINIYLDKDEVEDFYSELAEGSLRVVKVVK